MRLSSSWLFLLFLSCISCLVSVSYIDSTGTRISYAQSLDPVIALEPDRVEIAQTRSSAIVVKLFPNRILRGKVELSVVGLPRGLSPEIFPRSWTLEKNGQNKSAIVFFVSGDAEKGTFHPLVSCRIDEMQLQPQSFTLVVVEEKTSIPLMGLMVSAGIVALVAAFMLGARLRPHERGARERLISNPIGLRSYIGSREINEDSAVAINVLASFRSQPENRLLMAVADGMGGHRAGEIASSVCVKSITEYLRPYLESTSEEDFSLLMRRAIEKANSEILSISTERLEISGMGTTVVSAVISGSDLHVAWIGDSRAYLLRGDKACPLTRDHSKVQQLVDAGQLSPEEAKTHPERNVITRSVGRRSELTVETYRAESVVRDVLLLCSDGLTDIASDEEIAHVLCEAKSPQNACDQLIELCMSRGASDNVTVVVALL